MAAYLGPGPVRLRVGLVVGIIGVHPGELQFTAKLTPGTFASGPTYNKRSFKCQTGWSENFNLAVKCSVVQYM